MKTPWRIATATALALFALTPALLAQRSDDAWMDNCQDEHGSRYEKHCEVKVYQLSARSSIDVKPGQNGGVEVVAWDQPDIEVHARIQVNGESVQDARENARDIQIETDGGVIRATGPSMGRRNGWAVSFLVLVPRRMDIAASTHNGPLSVKNVTGRMNLDVVNGPLDLDGVGGNVTARAENGPLSVDLTGTRWEGTGLDAETRNGPVTIRIPEDYSAELETGTVNGPLDVAFPMTVTLQGRVPRRIRTTMGRGGAPVRVVTTNGPASIQRQ
jgi:DUF4097 and DUF4098 domain-containing protein YvlB